MSEERAPSSRLYRSRRERMVAGVAGGLAQYFNVDPVLIRLVFVVLAMTGSGILAYIILAIAVPERPEEDAEPAVPSTVGARGGQEALAYVLVGLGAVVLAGNLGLFQFLRGDYLLPLVLVGIGVLLLTRRGR